MKLQPVGGAPGGDSQTQSGCSPRSRSLRQGRWGGLGTVLLLTKCVDQYATLPLTDDRIAPLFVEAILNGRRLRRWYLLAWCIMPDHVHLVISPLPVGGAPVGDSAATVGGATGGDLVSRAMHSWS